MTRERKETGKRQEETRLGGDQTDQGTKPSFSGKDLHPCLAAFQLLSSSKPGDVKPEDAHQLVSRRAHLDVAVRASKTVRGLRWLDRDCAASTLRRSTSGKLADRGRSSPPHVLAVAPLCSRGWTETAPLQTVLPRRVQGLHFNARFPRFLCVSALVSSDFVFSPSRVPLPPSGSP
ncbi:hypothetical protein FQA47_005448 [Oryzias melastigma]|uniref:Uncharacterized protein n=1 Tax=Oryzias melastigma TaxID=30732 RepID=A0A834F116_ORYME|nr:hypothetical protein FQA47_005448 [Oryzias melastigma]